MPNQPRLPLPPTDYHAGAQACLRYMSAEGRQRTQAFWEARKTSATASAK